MVEPIGGFDHWRPLSGQRVGDADAIGGGAKVDLLVQRCRRKFLGIAWLHRVCRLADEAKALARNCADKSLFSAAVADSLADGIDAAVQR